jgi:hypothetical protein
LSRDRDLNGTKRRRSPKDKITEEVSRLVVLSNSVSLDETYSSMDSIVVLPKSPAKRKRE